MAQAPIGRPKLFQSPGTSTPGLSRGQKSDGGNTFGAGAFTVLKGLTLVAYTATDAAVWGLSPDSSHAATDEPYTQPFGENHNAIDPNGALFVMNLTDATGQVGVGTNTRLQDVTIGARYSAVYLSSVDTLALGINVPSKGTDASNIFQVVDKLDSATYIGYDAVDDTNGRVVVKLISTGIQ